MIYVHGSGHQDPPEVLKARFDRLLFGGPEPAARLAYYADVLHGDHPAPPLARLRAAAAGPGPELPARTDDTPFDVGAFDLDDEIAERLLALRARLQRHEDATTSDRPHWLEREAFRVLLATLLPDVGAYFFGGRAHEMAEPLRRVLRASGGPETLLTHSLGTVIAYHVLAEPEFAGLEIDHWLTLGSPLGIDEIRWLATRGAARPAPIPGPVRRWTNVADPLDPVALDATLRDEFGPAERIVEFRVSIPSRTHHAFAAYLSTPEVRAAALETSGPRPA